MSDPFSRISTMPADLQVRAQRASSGLSGAGWGRPDINTANGGAEELRQVADEFEALFLNQFLQAARKSQLAEGLLSSSEGDQFQSMLDAEFSRSASTGMSLGIADALFQQFSGSLPAKGD